MNLKKLTLKSIITVLSFAACSAAFGATAQNSEPSKAFRVGSFNILGGSPKKEGTFKRAEMGAALVRFHNWDIFGTQEMYPFQKEVYEGRDGVYGTAGRPCCTRAEDAKAWETWGNYIFYKKSRFELLDSGHFWLSETPETLSRSWGEKQYRICNWGKFRDKKTNKTFFFFDTHTGLTREARIGATKLLLSKIAEIAGNSPVLMTGDFNEEADKQSIKNILQSGIMNDSWAKSSAPAYGSNGSYMPKIYIPKTSKTGLCDGEPRVGTKIDFIFVSNGISVSRCAILSDNQGGSYPSDHLPIMATVKIEK